MTPGSDNTGQQDRIQGSAATTCTELCAHGRTRAEGCKPCFWVGGQCRCQPASAAARALPRRLMQLLGREVDYRDARHLRRHFCFSCDKRTVLEHTHTDAFVRRSRA